MSNGGGVPFRRSPLPAVFLAEMKRSNAKPYRKGSWLQPSEEVPPSASLSTKVLSTCSVHGQKQRQTAILVLFAIKRRNKWTSWGPFFLSGVEQTGPPCLTSCPYRSRGRRGSCQVPFWKTWFHLQSPSGNFHFSVRECKGTINRLLPSSITAPFHGFFEGEAGGGSDWG